jgi:hypothetical protein
MPSGKACRKLLFADRFSAGEHDRLGHAHGFRQMQPLGRILYLLLGRVLGKRLLFGFIADLERDNRSVGAFAHDATSTALIACVRPRR